MNKKRIIFLLKLVVLVVVLALVGRALWVNWHQVEEKHIAVDWRWGGIAVASFCLNMLISGLVWRFLASKMGDRSPILPLLGAYIFSQIGKYIPGKVALLLMRIERASRFGMTAARCTLSTLLENALYMISGGLVGMIAIIKVAGELDSQYRRLLWPVTIGAMIILGAVCTPPIFFGLVNRLLKRMNKPELPSDQWLSLPPLILAVLGFIPCWIFGGLALWACASAVFPVDLVQSWWFAGAFALSVIIGMASLLPGGAGVREALLGVAVMMQFQQAGVPHSQAVLYASLVAGLQRLFQVIAELVMAAIGALLTRRPFNPT